MSMTVPMKIALGTAAAGLVGGVVAERLTSPGSIERSRDGDKWKTLHDDFLDRHPAPTGTKVMVGQEPAWKNAALVGGAGAGIAALGGGAMLLATKLPTQNFPLFAGGLAAVTLGVGVLAGAGASWAVR